MIRRPPLSKSAAPHPAPPPDRAMTDLSAAFAAALDNINHLFTRPYRPQTNGKVERFNRTLTEEWAYARIYTSGNDRAQALQDWIHIYNHHRGHSAIGGPPISRVNDLPGHYN